MPTLEAIPVRTAPEQPPPDSSTFVTGRGLVTVVCDHEAIDYHMDASFSASSTSVREALAWARERGLEPIPHTESPAEILEDGLRIHFWHEGLAV